MIVLTIGGLISELMKMIAMTLLNPKEVDREAIHEIGRRVITVYSLLGRALCKHNPFVGFWFVQVVAKEATGIMTITVHVAQERLRRSPLGVAGGNIIRLNLRQP
jgi:hypothetical protein